MGRILSSRVYYPLKLPEEYFQQSKPAVYCTGQWNDWPAQVTVVVYKYTRFMQSITPVKCYIYMQLLFHMPYVDSVAPGQPVQSEQKATLSSETSMKP